MEKLKKYCPYVIIVALIISNGYFVVKSNITTPVATGVSALDTLKPIFEKNYGINIPLEDINIAGDGDYIVVSGNATKQNAIDFLKFYDSYNFMTELAMIAFPTEFFVSAKILPNDDGSLTVKTLNLGNFSLDTNINLFSK